MPSSAFKTRLERAPVKWKSFWHGFRPGRDRKSHLPRKAKPAFQLHLASATVQPHDRLLLFIALDGAPRGLDPIRLQKGMFLFAMDEGSDPGEIYNFVPYNYGPMSVQIYRDLESLTEQGLIEAKEVQGQSWSRYVATENGLLAARELLRQEPSEATARLLYAIKADVSSHTYREVLEDVYDRFPEYASKSVFRRAS